MYKMLFNSIYLYLIKPVYSLKVMRSESDGGWKTTIWWVFFSIPRHDKLNVTNSKTEKPY